MNTMKTYSITVTPSTGITLHFQSRLQGWTELEGTEYTTVAEAEVALEDAFDSIYAKGFTWWSDERPVVHIVENGEEGGIIKTVPIPRVY